MAGIFLILASVSLGAEDRIHKVQNVFDPHSTPAHGILGIAWIVLAICALIFVVVGSLLVYAIWRFREKRGDQGTEPPQVYGSNQIEMAWTVIPLLIVLVLILVTARTTIEIDEPAFPADALQIQVVGHQWWWEVVYPEQGFITANEIHIPVSSEDDPRPAIIQLASADVAHSFWVPQLGGKRDLLPNHPNRMWIEPEQTGVYWGNCAEFCGTQHANMLIRVVVDTPEEFEAWVLNQQRPPREDPAVAGGRHIFETMTCINCHAVGEKGAQNGFGPDLTHLMTRGTIGAGVGETSRDDLYQWLKDPDSMKPGCYMPDMKLSERQLNKLTDYLTTLK